MLYLWLVGRKSREKDHFVAKIRQYTYRQYELRFINENFISIISGYVMVRKRGVWGRLCVESFADVVEQAQSSLKLPDLGRAVCRAMTFQ